MILLPYVFILFFTNYFIPCESLKCYECTGHTPCGQGQTHLLVDCAGKCMVYRNQYDGDTIVRRCCTNDCGTDDGLQNYEGRYPAYFCSQDMCNSVLSDGRLSGGVISTTTSFWLTTTNNVSPGEHSSSLSCYDCTGHNSQCGISELTLIHGCKACMVYLNAYDSNTVTRRCCTSDCRSSGSIGDYEGRTTYFCSSNRCNGIGTETILNGGTGLTSTTRRTTSLFTTQTTTVTVQPSFQCYDCSGSNCGREGSTLSMNCPSCMVFRNPYDSTTIERRCCWWGCGPSNSVSTYNGIPAYFCSNNMCNGYGSEYYLGPPVTMTTSPTTTTYSSFTCTLNCQNGGTLEKDDGCFCYCLDNTSGRECENINCIQSGIDMEICTPENRPLCQQSEIFAFECRRLCGRC